MEDPIIVRDDDPMNAIIAELEAARVQQTPVAAALGQPPEVQTETPPETTDSNEPPPETTETAPKTDDDIEAEYKDRIKRAHIEAREEKRRAKRLEQELAVLKGQVTETKDETIAREVESRAQQMAQQNAWNAEMTRITRQYEKEHGTGSIMAIQQAVHEELGTGGVPNNMLETIMEISDGQEQKLIHWLGNNLDECRRIAEMTPAKAAAAMIRVQERLNKPKEQSKSAPPPKPPTSAPKVDTSGTVDISKMTPEQLIRHWDAEDLRKRTGTR